MAQHKMSPTAMAGEAPECFVRGALALTLHVSRALGVAPLSMKRVHTGWRVSSSRRSTIYSYIWISLLHFGMVFGLYYEFTSTREDSIRMRSATSGISWSIILVINVVMSTAGVIDGPRRMALMVDYVYKMDNIHKKFCNSKAWQPNERKKTVAAGIVLFVLLFLYGLEYCDLILKIIAGEINWPKLVLFACLYMELMMINVLTMQFVFSGYMIESSMKYINQSFGELVYMDDLQIKSRSYSLIEGVLDTMMPLPKFYSITEKYPIMSITTVAERRTDISDGDIAVDNINLPSMSSYGAAYAVVCSILLEVNDSFETMLILQISVIFIQSLLSVHSYMVTDSAKDQPYEYHAYGLIRCVIQVFFLLMTTEPAQRIKFQVQKMRFMQTHLLRRVDPNDPRCPELHFLYEQLTLDNPVFVVKGICKLRRSLLFLMISGIFTYITFFLQFELSE